MIAKIPILTVSVWLLALAELPAAERFPWLTDLDQARQLAAVQDMPLLIVFRCEP